MIIHGYPIIWAGGLQTEICINTTESKYVILFRGMHSTILLLECLKDIRDILLMNNMESIFNCSVLEDKMKQYS